jgi:hypothetical protein
MNNSHPPNHHHIPKSVIKTSRKELDIQSFKFTNRRIRTHNLFLSISCQKIYMAMLSLLELYFKQRIDRKKTERYCIQAMA